MLPELSESEATGAHEKIYADIRELCRVPYVSSMQRHLATRPGWLEWIWEAIRPAFADGRAQAAAWAQAEPTKLAPLPVLSRPALRVLGVNEKAELAIRSVCEGFVRLSPTNLVFSGLVRQLLTGAFPGGKTADATPPPLPEALPRPPSLVDPSTLPPDEREVLMSLGTEVDGEPFVPGLYRMLAHWPAYLAHVATELAPRFSDQATRIACARLEARLDGCLPELLSTLPPLPDYPPRPDRHEFDAVLDALERYRATSPQMVVFATLVRDALPPPEVPD